MTTKATIRKIRKIRKKQGPLVFSYTKGLFFITQPIIKN
uniref:Uncharacterized protein n=1 Tax=viral metagenome TaxID=1070528 RepID=A0A6C0BGP2_9ZZZZ